MSGGAQARTIELNVAPDLAGRVIVGAVAAAPVATGPASPDLTTEIEGYEQGLRQKLQGRAPSEIPGLGPARELYRAFGIDPTKTRPSSEALLRRVLRGDPLPRILNAVDVANLLAVQFLLPIGLYDADRVEGPVLLRRGLSGESYVGVRKDEVHLEGRPVLVDQSGPFGNPTADSARTCVGPATCRLWLVLFAPASYPRDAFDRHLDQARRDMERHLRTA